MQLLYGFQSIRNPALDAIMSLVTRMGEETVFMVLGLVMLWCVDKKWGYRLLLTGLVGTAVNQLLKAIFLIPRPWVLDPDFTIVESARAEATGYSFPSGHTQMAATAYGMLAARKKKKGVTIAMAALILAVGISRMYLGVHTPYDVGVSLATGLLTVVGMLRLFAWAEGEDSRELRTHLLGLALATVLLLYVLFAPKRAANVAEFDAHGVDAAWKLLGTMLGLIAAWLLDRRVVRYETKAVWWAQVLKVVLGLGVVMAVRLGAKPVLNQLMGGHMAAGAVRYFLMCLIGCGVWPMTFKAFSRLGRQVK